MTCPGHINLFDALRRGEDHTRAPGTYSIHPYPQMIGCFQSFAPLANNVLHAPAQSPAPNVLVGTGQYGVLPKNTG